METRKHLAVLTPKKVTWSPEAILSACGTRRALGLCSGVCLELPRAAPMAFHKAGTGWPVSRPPEPSGKDASAPAALFGCPWVNRLDSIKPFQSQVHMISIAICFQFKPI